MQPWDSRRLVPSIQSGWIWAPLDIDVGIRWKPKPQAANRTKLSSHTSPLLLRSIRAARPQ